MNQIATIKNIFRFLEYEFFDLKNKGHPLYIKNKGHRFKEISINSIQLNSVTEDVFDFLCERINNKFNDNSIYIVDWKYVPFNFFSKSSEKFEVDIVKQLTYEFCMTHSKNSADSIISQFCIPKYSNTDDFILDSDNKILSAYGIEVVSLNFDILQRIYINDSIVLY